jgi:hypothetical protein
MPGFLEDRRGQESGVRIDVAQHDLASDVANDLGGRGEGERRNEHAIPRPDPRRLDREVQRRRAGVDRDGVLGAGRLDEPVLEPLREPRRGQPAALEHLLQVGEFVAVALDSVEGDVHRKAVESPRVAGPASR